MALLPQLAGNWQRFDAEILPPARFVARLVQIAVTAAAERDRELVAHLHSDRLRLRKAQVMHVARLASR